MIMRIPISNENGIVPSRVREWDRNSWPAENFDPSKASGRLVECQRREVEETTNLIFHLQSVGVVFPWRDWTSSTINPILERISPLLNSIPVSFFSPSTPRQKTMMKMIK